MKTELNSETFEKKRKKYKSISIISLSEDYISLLQILITSTSERITLIEYGSLIAFSK